MIITNGVGITTLKNGVAVKQALSAANSTVNKGVYDATLLETVDPDLAVANILQPVNIFGKVGTVVAGVDVSDADALVTDVKDPKTFYSVAAPRKTGTMPTVAITDVNSAYPAGYHAGNVGGLEAIDADLVAANIKSGVTIFGKLGTLAPGALAEDVEGDTVDTNVTTSAQPAYRISVNAAVGGDGVTLATKTLNFNATSLAFAAAFASAAESAAGEDCVLRLYMGGVLMQTSAELPVLPNTLNFVLRDFKALVGNQVCKLTAFVPVNGGPYFYGGDTNSQCPAAIAVGSVKIV